MKIDAIRVLNLFKFYKILIISFTFIILFFQVALSKLSILPSFSDELVLAGILLVSITRSFIDPIIKKFMQIYFIAFIFFFLISLGAIPHRGIFSVCLQIFIHLKFILFVSFIWMTLGVKHALKASYIFLAITIVFLFINIFTNDLFNQLFDTVVMKRGWGVRPIGIQADTASLGTTIALFGCLLICSFKNISNNIKMLALILFSILVILSTVRTALILIPLIVLWWLKDSMKSFFIALLFIVVMGVSLKSTDYTDEIIDITVQNIEWTVENPVESAYIRGIMLFFSVDIANSRFPIGTGAATYGTVTSDDSYVYAEIGLHNSRFFIEKEGIYDSNFASLLGEFGYLGLIVFLYVFYLIMHVPIIKGKYENNAEFRFVLYLLVVGYSIATPIFMNTYPAFILALVIVASYHSVAPDLKNKNNS